jgi:hypothetical protein
VPVRYNGGHVASENIQSSLTKQKCALQEELRSPAFNDRFADPAHPESDTLEISKWGVNTLANFVDTLTNF